MERNEDFCRTTAGRILERVRADDALVTLQRVRQMSTRFAANLVSQNVDLETQRVTVEVAFGDRRGSAKVESFDPEALDAVVQRAEEAAREAPPDPEFLPFLGPQEYLPVEAWDEATADLPAADRIGIAQDVITAVRRASCQAAGTVEITPSETAVATRAGLFAWHARTDVEIGCTVTAPDSSGWAHDVSGQVGGISAASVAARAIEGALGSARPRTLQAGRYTVVLLPAAASNLLGILVGSMDARMTDEGTTFLSGKVGERLAGEEIHVTSDPRDPALPTMPFSSEGVPHQPVTWIDRGFFVGRHADRFTARRLELPPTPFPLALRMEGTDKPLPQLIAGVERGILVTRFWYIRPLQMHETLWTGMTRDGTFLIEDGRIAGGVASMRWNDSCLGMLQRTIDRGTPELCGYAGNCVVCPPLVVRDWNFVSSAE